MSDLSDTIKGFYSDFILRDLLSFVTPGAIVTGAFIFMMSGFFSTFIPIQYSDLIPLIVSGGILWRIFQMPIYVWILLFGLFYIIGIGVQHLGERTTLTQFPPKRYENKNSEYSFGIGDKDKITDSQYYEKFRLPFIQKTKDTDYKKFETERKYHERFIVLMQTSGNSGIAFFVAAILIFVGFIIDQFSQQFFLLLVGGLLIISVILILSFQTHRKRLLDWEVEVITHHILSNRSFSRSHFRRRL
jgi:hypothetical protein